MMDKILMKFIPRILIVLTLGTIMFMLCAGIIDRVKFHCEVKKAAIADIKTMLGNNRNSASYCFMDSVKGTTLSEIDKQISTSNSIIVINKPSDDQSNQPYSESLLYVLSQSDGLLNANGLTFCVTLVVSLLAALLLYKIDTNDKIIEQNREAFKVTKKIIQQTTENIHHAAKFNQLLVRIESAYNVTIFIGNMSMMLPTTNDTSNCISENTGQLCSRLSLICDDINIRLSKRESRLDFLTKDEQVILNMYLEDVLGELNRSLLRARHIKNDDLCIIIDKILDTIKGIIDQVDAIEVK